jgi:outer membrane murein-binding lipoprotein Lpp
MAALAASTNAIKSGTSADDSRYTAIEAQLSSLTSQRDALASQIRGALDEAAFDNASLNEQQAKGWISQASDLIDQATALASS